MRQCLVDIRLGGVGIIRVPAVFAQCFSDAGAVFAGLRFDILAANVEE